MYLYLRVMDVLFLAEFRSRVTPRYLGWGVLSRYVLFNFIFTFSSPNFSLGGMP